MHAVERLRETLRSEQSFTLQVALPIFSCSQARSSALLPKVGLPSQKPSAAAMQRCPALNE